MDGVLGFGRKEAQANGTNQLRKRNRSTFVTEILLAYSFTWIPRVRLYRGTFEIPRSNQSSSNSGYLRQMPSPYGWRLSLARYLAMLGLALTSTYNLKTSSYLPDCSSAWTDLGKANAVPSTHYRVSTDINMAKVFLTWNSTRSTYVRLSPYSHGPWPLVFASRTRCM